MRRVGVFRIVAGLVAGVFFASAMAETTVERIKRRSSIIVGYRDAASPFSYVYQDKPVGYSIDLCKMVIAGVSKNLQRDLKVEYQPISVENRINAVVENKVDIVCGSTPNIFENRQKVSFAIPHYISTRRLMVRGDSPYIPKDSNRQLAKIAATAVSESTLKKYNFRIDPALMVSNNDLAFNLLKSGKADAVMMNGVLLSAYRAESDNPANYVILDTTYSVEAIGLMFQKDDREFKEMVDGEIKKIIADGRLYSLYKTWFESPIPPKNINLKWPMTESLKNTLKYPSDWTLDL